MQTIDTYKDFTNARVQDSALGYDISREYMKHVFIGNVTRAEANASKILLPARTGITYRVLNIVLIARGGASNVETSINFLDTAGVVIVAFLVAALAQNTYVQFGDANVTESATAAFGHPVTADAGIKITATTTEAQATSFDVIIEYVIDGTSS